MKEKIFKFFIEAFGRQVPDSVAPTSVSPEVVRSGDWLWDGYSWIPEWESILGEDWSEWKKLSQTSKSGPKVLIATSVGGNSTLTPLETLFAMALTLRGADVHFLLCDKTLPACQNCSGATLEEQKSFVENGPSLCDWCYETGSKAIEQLGLTVHKYSSLLDKSDWLETQELVASCSLEEILSWDKDGLNLGEIVQSASLRFFGRSDFEGESLVSPVVKKYMQSALLSNIALEKLFKNYRFEHTVINQGIYVPQANAVAAARRNNSHVVTWDIAYRELCINLSHDDTFIKNNSEEPSSTWEEMFWSEDTLAEIKEYMIGRWTGKFDWLQVITGEYSGEPDSIARELGIDSSKPTIGLLTNVIWDAQLAYPNNAFQNQMEWIISTIEYFKSRPDLNLLIRVHPAEVKSWIRTKQMAVEEIKKSFSTLPENVFVIPPESKINTYKAMTNCNAVLIYGTTTGLEMACMRLPVIVAGQAWIRNKGISEDVNSPEEYKQALDRLPFVGRLSDQQWERAMKYAYHFYLRKMIPIGVIQKAPFENAPYSIPKMPLSRLAAGSDKGLDLVCEGLGWIEGEVLRLPAEESGLKVPHIGWNDATIKTQDNLLGEIDEVKSYYFVHSFYLKPENEKEVVATCDYGIDFTCAIQKDNIFAVQFHAEKSQKHGLSVLRNFLTKVEEGRSACHA